MNDPQRLLDAGTDTEHALLRAAASEEPPANGRLRLAAALGLGVAGTTSAAASAKVATTGVAKLVGKGVLLLTSAAALVAGGVYVNRSASPDKPVAVRPSSAPTPQVRADDRVSRLPEPGVAAAETALPTAVPSTARRALPARATIAAEIAALDRVRRDLPGDPRAALATLARYDREFPSGVLRQEALLLRIESLARSGNQAAARRLAQRFLDKNPKTPHEHRVRALVGLPP